MEFIALGRVISSPRTRFSRFALLGSPLIGLDEDQLYLVAHGRGRTLWRWARRR
jgi:ATP-dependent helicase/nuclease subunit A